MNAFALMIARGQLADAVLDDGQLVCLLNDEPLCRLQLQMVDTHHLRLLGTIPALPGLSPDCLLPALAQLFCRQGALQTVSLQLAVDADFARQAVRSGVASQWLADGSLLCSRAAFWQHSRLWLTQPSSAGMPLEYVMSGEKRHPRRPPQPEGVVYRRYLPQLDSVFSLRVATLAQDLDHFHGWMNQDRVHRFWELAGDRDSHAAYLAAQIDNPKVVPLIGQFDDEPFAYLESYWAREDRIAPFYDAQDYDRGCHVLVGNSRHRGPAKVSAWLRATCHYLFLDEPRTQRVVGEPRVDNTHFIAYLQQQGFAKLKEFDFPHKRAAMMVLEREAFFGQYGPWGQS